MDADASSFKDSKDAVDELPATVDTVLAKRVVRKLDWRLMPIMFITYNFNFIDKTILSSASVFGLKEGTVRLQTHTSPHTHLTTRSPL